MASRALNVKGGDSDHGSESFNLDALYFIGSLLRWANYGHKECEQCADTEQKWSDPKHNDIFKKSFGLFRL